MTEPTPDELGLIARAFGGSGVDLGKTSVRHGALPTDILTIDPRRLFCPVHGEYLRERWPTGFAACGMALSSAALDSGPLLAEVGWKAGEAPPIEAINALTARKPFCYFVDDDVIRTAYRKSGLLEVRLCQVCGDRGEATTFSDSENGSYILCLECMLGVGHRQHAACPDGGCWTA